MWNGNYIFAYADLKYPKLSMQFRNWIDFNWLEHIHTKKAHFSILICDTKQIINSFHVFGVHDLVPKYVNNQFYT